jgi:hypothetical protein
MWRPVVPPRGRSCCFFWVGLVGLAAVLLTGFRLSPVHVVVSLTTLQVVLHEAVDDSRPAMAVGPGEHAMVLPTSQESAPTGAGTAVGTLHDSRRTTAVVPAHRPVVVLGHDSAAARVSMAIMAASMAYMFAAMQMMR